MRLSSGQNVILSSLQAPVSRHNNTLIFENLDVHFQDINYDRFVFSAVNTYLHLDLNNFKRAMLKGGGLP